MKRASIYTLGCRLNQADTALINDDLVRHGFTLVEWGEPAELLVVNSCMVTAAASRKSRQAIRAARRANPAGYLVLAGCDVSIDQRQAWPEDVDLIVPNPVKTRLCAFLPPDLQRPPTTQLACATNNAAAPDALFHENGTGLYREKTRANLKIQEGCNFYCSYCIVPYARGHSRSRAWSDVLREAQELVARGHQEIVLTGVNIACYNDHGRTLADLMTALLDEIPGDFRIRLSSTETTPELPRLLRVMQESDRVCRFLHLPLQYAEDTLLKSMNRRYTFAEFTAFAHQAVAAIPGLCLGSDLIVGYPGETDAVFAECQRNIETLPFAYLHVFRYSKRTGTVAAGLPGQVNAQHATARHRKITEIAAQKAQQFAQTNLGKTLPVLVETRNRNGNCEGWSDNYLRVEITTTTTTTHNLAVNRIYPVQITTLINGRKVRGRLKPSALNLPQ